MPKESLQKCGFKGLGIWELEVRVQWLCRVLGQVSADLCCLHGHIASQGNIPGASGGPTSAGPLGVSLGKGPAYEFKFKALEAA